MPDNKQWNILCWNIRGMNSEDKQLAIRNAIELSGCAVVCLQETKRTSFDRSFIKLFCPKKLDKYLFVPSCGASGGLFIAWNSSIFAGTLMFSESFALGVHFTATQSANSWKLVNVYGPCTNPERQAFTDFLFNLDIQDDEDLILMGDFNFIRSPDNRNKPGGNTNDMMLFNELIREQSLVELPIKGRRFTWSNMQDSPLLEQLDWFFTSVNWTSTFPNTQVMPQCKPISDHIPCVVSIESSIPKSKVFRFENFWISHPGFFDIV